MYDIARKNILANSVQWVYFTVWPHNHKQQCAWFTSLFDLTITDSSALDLLHCLTSQSLTAMHLIYFTVWPHNHWQQCTWFTSQFDLTITDSSALDLLHYLTLQSLTAVHLIYFTVWPHNQRQQCTWFTSLFDLTITDSSALDLLHCMTPQSALPWLLFVYKWGRLSPVTRLYYWIHFYWRVAEMWPKLVEVWLISLQQFCIH